MAKKVVATLKKEGGVTYAKVIRAIKSEKQAHIPSKKKWFRPQWFRIP
jgi:hypothetical protein